MNEIHLDSLNFFSNLNNLQSLRSLKELLTILCYFKNTSYIRNYEFYVISLFNFIINQAKLS